MEIIKLTSTLMMPILCMYVIMALNIFERRYRMNDEPYSSIRKINLRDIFLVTIVLDIVAMVSAFSIGFDPSYTLGKTELIISFILLLLHLVMAVNHRIKSNEKEQEDIKFRLIEVYLSFIILFTNAITVKTLILNTI